MPAPKTVLKSTVVVASLLLAGAFVAFAGAVVLFSGTKANATFKTVGSGKASAPPPGSGKDSAAPAPTP